MYFVWFSYVWLNGGRVTAAANKLLAAAAILTAVFGFVVVGYFEMKWKRKKN